MGIPAFYRWIIERYPRSVVDVVEDSLAVVNGVKVPVDTTMPNPNGVEFDNLYLDMNGIIHPCFHPENLPSPQSYDEVFIAVFKYIDRIFSLIRPRKLLYMAIDGVAPRAKMNQQRARRFRAAKDTADEASLLDKRRGGCAENGGASLSKGLDSNVITPGTGFMELLSSALQYYIHLRMNHDPGWKGIKVILSDASVPGEGEHKIMSYIRLQRNLPGFDPNTRHCLYGLDADLIMLALATHEVHFSVLREDVCRVPSNGKGPCRDLEDFISRQKFQFLNVWVLRDYLAENLRILDPLVKVELERLIDDFVFMCLFVGNDFLPHVPSLEISEGAIDLLMFVYKREFVRMGGYLTDSSEVNLERVEHFVRTLASHENAIFKKRRQEQMGWEMHARRSPAKMNTSRKQAQILANHGNSEARFVVEKVNLGEDGWKERYYTEKFEVQTDDDRERVQKHAVLKYVEGICWVMHYYYQGVCSWQWFYPYHYAPFASDFHSLDQLKIHFVLGKPFKPFNQLMGVLPAASAHALPSVYSNLMTDPSSPILDFYPTEFELDLNGRKQAWKAVCRLPFIDEGRLLTEIAKLEPTLTDVERLRNTLGLDKLFVHVSHTLAAKMFTFLERNKDNPKLHKAKVKTKINPKLSGGMNGYMYISDRPICPAEISSPLCDMKTIMNNKVVFVFYKFPHFHPHIPRPPEGVIMPPKSIRKCDLLPAPTLWHEKTALVQSRLMGRPLPSKFVAGRSLAKVAHQLVSGTYLVSSSEDHGNNRKRSHDALNDSREKNEDHGNNRKRSHDALNDNRKKRKKNSKRRKKEKIEQCPSVAADLAAQRSEQVVHAMPDFASQSSKIDDALKDNRKEKSEQSPSVAADFAAQTSEQVSLKIDDTLNDNRKKRKKNNKKRKKKKIEQSPSVASDFAAQRSEQVLHAMPDFTSQSSKIDDALNDNTKEKIQQSPSVAVDFAAQRSEQVLHAMPDFASQSLKIDDALNDNRKKRKKNNKKRKKKKIEQSPSVGADFAAQKSEQVVHAMPDFASQSSSIDDALNDNRTEKIEQNLSLTAGFAAQRFEQVVHAMLDFASQSSKIDDALNDNRKEKIGQSPSVAVDFAPQRSEQVVHAMPDFALQSSKIDDVLNDNRKEKIERSPSVVADFAAQRSEVVHAMTDFASQSSKIDDNPK